METTWISTEVELPPEGQAVLVWDGGLHIAKLTRGITQETREKMRRGEIGDPVCVGWSFVGGNPTQHKRRRSEVHEAADEWGNNHKPYNWQTQGHGQLYGQDVKWWTQLPTAPEPGAEKLKTKDKTGAECALSILLIALGGGTVP